MKQELVCLLVDDDRDDQQILSEAIHEVAPEAICLTASDGIDAMEKLREEKINPDYIFLDINMPRMNGCEFLKSIKRMKDLKNIPVVVHSTSTSSGEVERLVQLGASGVHVKSCDYKSICGMLRKYLSK
jgi:CheY-like chemotaxis protein